jgi:hypothetical protein
VFCVFGIESHKEYNRLCKNGVNTEFSLLQKLKETTQKNTKLPPLPGLPVGYSLHASTRHCTSPRPCACPRLPACVSPPAPASASPPARAHAPSVACRSVAARAPVQDGAPAHDHAPALARRLARGCAQEREGRGRQLVLGLLPCSTPGIHYRLVH